MFEEYPFKSIFKEAAVNDELKTVFITTFGRVTGTPDVESSTDKYIVIKDAIVSIGDNNHKTNQVILFISQVSAVFNIEKASQKLKY